jgi:hypothetical protein
VLLRVPRVLGRRQWASAAAGFDAALTELAGTDAPGAHIISAAVESESRRGRDQVTVNVAISVSAAGTGTAFAAAWDAVRDAAAGDPAGWDWAGASAEGVPVARLAPGLTRCRERPRAQRLAGTRQAAQLSYGKCLRAVLRPGQLPDDGARVEPYVLA